MKQMLSRRNWLKLVGLGAVASQLDWRQAAAQSNPSFSDQSAFYRFKVGDFELISINDGTLNFPTPAFGVNAPDGALAALLEQHYLPTDFAVMPAHLLVVNTDDHRVLLDTGLGDVVLPGDVPNGGKLASTLDMLGITDIDTVILTHAHPDHIGGAVTPDGQPAFPNATYYLPQADWDFWTRTEPNTDDDFMNFMLQTARNKLLPLDGQLELLTEETEIVPGVRTVAAPGHTLGHIGLMIESAGDRLLNIADTAVHYLVALQQPEWIMAVEMDPAGAFASRQRLLGMAAAERIKVFGYHFPFPGLGYVLPNGDGWDWFPTG